MSAYAEFVVDPDSGLIAPAIHVASANCDERPVDQIVDLIVIHAISLPPGKYGGGYIEQFFTNCLDCMSDPYFAEIRNLQVSSHLLVSREGQVTQFVPFQKRAWHAGESSFRGRERCNDFSIGIELEGTDDSEYTDAQYRTLNAVIQSLHEAYPRLATAEIVGHSDIAPGRKTDPGNCFDWCRIDARLAKNA